MNNQGQKHTNSWTEFSPAVCITPFTQPPKRKHRRTLLVHSTVMIKLYGDHPLVSSLLPQVKANSLYFLNDHNFYAKY